MLHPDHVTTLGQSRIRELQAVAVSNRTRPMRLVHLMPVISMLLALVLAQRAF